MLLGNIWKCLVKSNDKPRRMIRACPGFGKPPHQNFTIHLRKCSRPCLGQSTRWVETNPLVFWCWIIHVHQLRINLFAGYLRLALLCRPLFWLVENGMMDRDIPQYIAWYDPLSSTNRGFEHCHTSTCLKSGFFHVGLQTHNFPYSKFWLGIFQRMFFYFLDLGMGQNHVPLVNIKIAGKWMFIPLKMYL